jgi:hypothetical protein
LSIKRLTQAAAIAGVMLIGSAAVEPVVAEAQTMPVQIESGAKGAVGLGLIGAELGFFIPAAVGLHELWAFIVFPLVGGAGGAVGGYFAFDANNNVELSVAFLAIGMGLILPTLVATLAFTAYDPGPEPESSDDAAMEEEFGDEEPAAEPAAQRARDRAIAGAGLLHVGNGERLELGVPGVTVRQTFSRDELSRFGGEQREEVHVPVVTGTF